MTGPDIQRYLEAFDQPIPRVKRTWSRNVPFWLGDWLVALEAAETLISASRLKARDELYEFFKAWARWITGGNVRDGSADAYAVLIARAAVKIHRTRERADTNATADQRW